MQHQADLDRPLFWPATPQELDASLWRILCDAEVSVADTRRSAAGAPPAFLAGLQQFVSRHAGEGHVLIKTSTAGGRSTSHEVPPAVVQDVLGIVLQAYEPSRIFLGDGPSVPTPFEAECRRMGWDRVAGSLHIKMTDLNREPCVASPGGEPVSELFVSADMVINLTKAKTHRRFGVSLAEKSLLGVLCGDRTGYPKVAGHHGDVPMILASLDRMSPPIYSIIDGFAGIEGEGPLSGDVARSHFVVFGAGCVAADLRATIEMGFDPALVPMYHRPVSRSTELPEHGWSDLRTTFVDFLPPRSCAWLYRSLKGNGRRRHARFAALARGARIEQVDSLRPPVPAN